MAHDAQAPQLGALADAQARPKVLRRPAQFSQKTVLVLPTVPEPPVLAPKVPAVIAPATVPWQEDGRFGLVLILVVACVNGALAWLLPEKAPLMEAEIVAPAHVGSHTLPSATTSRLPSSVTVYSEPDGQDPLTVHDLPADYNRFITAPDSVPAPTAHWDDER